MEPDYHNAHKNLGLSLEKQGRWLKAAEAYRQAVRTWPADRRAFDHLNRLLEGHPGLAMENPELQDFLDAAAVVVEHARAIAAFADPERKGPDLPVPLQPLVTAAQIARGAEEKLWVEEKEPLRKTVYRSTLLQLSKELITNQEDSAYPLSGIFCHAGLTALEFTYLGQQAAGLINVLLNA